MSDAGAETSSLGPARVVQPVELAPVAAAPLGEDDGHGNVAAARVGGRGKRAGRQVEGTEGSRSVGAR